ncbi:MAG TPA: metal ABC transporter permease [Chloroflexi bacterium]|jgi:ABC-type Mn2+/Zn2+ transport system permease subunit|nr:metal ABC transporter permease [Chloroflexota bacterium]
MTTLIDVIAQPLSHAFMVRGLVAALLVGVVCAILGTYVVLRGMAFLGDALAHSILPGIAVGYLVGGGTRGPLFWWALGTGIVAALGIGAISRQGQIKEDTAIGVIFAGMLALGVALISTARSYSVDLAHFLFGDVLGVATEDLLLSGVFGALVLLLVLAFYKEFLVVSFDPIMAATLRLPTRFFDYLMLVMLAVTVVISLQTVGVALMVAMLVTPAATALLLTRRLPAMMAVSAGIGAFSAIAGLYLSYYANVASGAAIVLVATTLFGLAFLLSPERGVLARRAAERTPPPS